MPAKYQFNLEIIIKKKTVKNKINEILIEKSLYVIYWVLMIFLVSPSSQFNEIKYEILLNTYT